MPGPQRGRAQRSPTPGPGTIYSELNLSDCRSRSLPLLDDNTKEDHSYKLSTPSPSPPQLSPKLHAKKPSNQAHSHSLDKLCNDSFYQLASQPGHPRDTKHAMATQNSDVTYAEVPCEPIPNWFVTEENTYEQIPEPRHTSNPKGSPGLRNPYETLETCKPKASESAWGSKVSDGLILLIYSNELCDTRYTMHDYRKCCYA